MITEQTLKENDTFQMNNVLNEYNLCSHLSCKEDIIKFVDSLLKTIEKENITIIQSFVFAGTNYTKDYVKAFHTNNYEVPPYTWVSNGDQDSIYGIQMFGIKNVQIDLVNENDTTIGYRFRDKYVEYCFLNGIVPENNILSESDQTNSVLKKTDKTLESLDMKWTDVLRTWFYNRDILAWYDTFNEVRTNYYTEKGIFKNIIPASTGIDGYNDKNKHLTLGLLSVKPLDNRTVFKEVDSPLQGSACSYGSSFSRATEIITPEYNKIYISGTASIDKEGDTIHLNDKEKQVQQTIDTVEKILSKANMSFKNITRGTAYCKTQDEFNYFKTYIKDNRMQNLPIIITRNIICRDNLLFELEVDAIKI